MEESTYGLHYFIRVLALHSKYESLLNLKILLGSFHKIHPKHKFNKEMKLIENRMSLLYKTVGDRLLYLLLDVIMS